MRERASVVAQSEVGPKRTPREGAVGCLLEVGSSWVGFAEVGRGVEADLPWYWHVRLPLGSMFGVACLAVSFVATLSPPTRYAAMPAKGYGCATGHLFSGGRGSAGCATSYKACLRSVMQH